MNIKQKKVLIAIAIFIIFLLIFIRFFLNNKKVQKTQEKEIIPTEAVIPTIDGSVQVNLTARIPGKEIVLSINSIPKGTNTVEYSLSYATRQQGLQGVIGTLEIKETESDFEKDITLGTCSSGRCVYHEVLGMIKLNLKFSGSYGEKIFEKDYQI